MKIIFKHLIVLIGTTFFTHNCFGQLNATFDSIPNKNLVFEKILDFKPTWTNNNEKLELKTFSVKTLPIFCKIEHQIEKISKIPLRMRLGDLNYVNMLENKN